MKLIAFCFFVFVVISTFCAFAQDKSLLLIKSDKADTITFVTGDHIVILSNNFDTQIKGRLNEIYDSSLMVGNKLVALHSIKHLREKKTPGMVIVKTIGISIAVIGFLSTFLIAVMPPIQPESSQQQQQYEDDKQEYHKAIAIGASITALGATTLLIQNPKYDFSKGWHPYIYSPVEVPNSDSTKIFTDEPKLNDSISLFAYNHKISNNVAYLQFSNEIINSIFYDRIWKINNNINLSTSIGLGNEKYSDGFIIPFSLGCVFGKKQHRIEIGQMTWLDLDGSNPSLLGILAYRFQSYKGQIFFRGGLQITELSEYNYDHSVHPFGSIGIGF